MMGDGGDSRTDTDHGAGEPGDLWGCVRPSHPSEGEAHGPRGFVYYQLGSEPILETLSPTLLTHTLQPGHWAFGAPHSGASPSKASPVWITLSLLILLNTVNMSPPQGGIL